MLFDTVWDSKRLQRHLCILFLPLVLLLPLGCGPKDTAPTGGNSSGGSGQTGSQTGSDDSYKKSRHLALGNPSSASQDYQNNYLLIRDQYALAYNDGAGQANWVSWNLRSEDLGDADRGNFAPDTSLPEGFTLVTPRDYTNSGYDRGHLCPSADRTATPEDNVATFLMSNIIPQAPGNNQGPWKQLEDESRDLVRSGLNLTIVAGGGGTKKKTIGRGKVVVPVFTWKIIVVLPEGKEAPQDISAASRIIAIRMPNISTIKRKNWRDFRVSPKEIEDETGYKFLTTVAPNIREGLLQRVDTQ